MDEMIPTPGSDDEIERLEAAWDALAAELLGSTREMCPGFVSMGPPWPADLGRRPWSTPSVDRDRRRPTP